MAHAIHSACRRCGAAAVELAVVLPLIVAFLLGLLEVGRLVEVRQLLANAAREGGRQASTNRLSNADVATVVKDYLKNAGLLPAQTQNVTVTVQNLTHPGTDAKDAPQHDRLEVTVNIPFADVRLVNATLVTTPATTLSAQAVWYSLKDKPYPPPPEPPIE